eukprot:SAG22_NODE_3795_length_1528_cov_1.261721_2_plen_185_part_00
MVEKRNPVLVVESAMTAQNAADAAYDALCAAHERAAAAATAEAAPAAADAVRAHPAHAFRHSPRSARPRQPDRPSAGDRPGAGAADALFVTLVCRATRDLMYLRFDRRGVGEKDVGLRGKRFATPDWAVVCSVSRLEWPWAMSLSQSMLAGVPPRWDAERGELWQAHSTFSRHQSVCDRIARTG